MTLFTDDDPKDILPFDGTARYIPTFIAADEADRHFTGLVEETPWEHRHIVLFGREVLQPRLACWYGDHAYSYSGIRLEPRAWTDRLRALRDRCSVDSGAEFNSCLVNLYRDGRDSMGWHADDEPELGHEPVIASLSLGDTRVFRMRHKETKTVVELPLEHGSLLIMSGLMQQCWVHEIPKTKKPVGQRINLTFRTIITDADRLFARRRADV
jgi:alkylated DNA repair dioxygenase AlkB